MGRRSAARVLALLTVATVVTGCVLASTIPTERQYALARHVNTHLAILAADDPLYERFDAQVLADPTLQRLLMVFEHTTESFLATNATIPAPQTVANHLVVVLDSDTSGVLHDVRLTTPDGEARVELALGLGQGGEIDLQGARQRMAAAMGPLLLELVGRRAPAGFTMATVVAPDQPVSPDEALWAGYALALEADYARPFLGETPLDEAIEALNPLPDDLLARQRMILAWTEGEAPPFGRRLTRYEAVRTPSAVAAFLAALHRQAGYYYPQQYMLWMVSYEPDEVPYAKVLLAMMRMPPRQASVEDLVTSYADTYPAERASVRALADAVLGPAGE